MVLRFFQNGYLPRRRINKRRAKTIERMILLAVAFLAVMGIYVGTNVYMAKMLLRWLDTDEKLTRMLAILENFETDA